MAEEDEKRMKERRMGSDVSEQEKTEEIWTGKDESYTSSDVEREYKKGKTPRVDSDLPTFKGEIKVNEEFEGRGANVIGNKQSGGYSWTKGGTSSEEISRRERNR